MADNPNLAAAVLMRQFEAMAAAMSDSLRPMFLALHTASVDLGRVVAAMRVDLPGEETGLDGDEARHLPGDPDW